MGIALTSEEAAELAVVVLAVAEHLRSQDQPVPAFALNGVVAALARAIADLEPHD